MQVCDCLVLVGGDIGNSVMRYGVTAPEVAILRSIYGDDAVRDIVIKSNEKIDHATERDRLSLTYKEDVVAAMFGKFGDLPETLAEARVQDDLIVGDESKKGGKKKNPEQTAEQPETAGSDEQQPAGE